MLLRLGTCEAPLVMAEQSYEANFSKIAIVGPFLHDRLCGCYTRRGALAVWACDAVMATDVELMPRIRGSVSTAARVRAPAPFDGVYSLCCSVVLVHVAI